MSIKYLYQCTGDRISYLLPKTALPLGDLDVKLDVMLSSESVLFQVIWEKQMETSASIEQNAGVKLTVEDIRTVLWGNTFKECKNLLDSLLDRSIKLGEVNRYFGPIDIYKISSELEKLVTCVNCCDDSSHTRNPKWIDGVVQHVQDFWSLLTLAEEARAVMTLKSKLLLVGDFEAVMTLSNQVITALDPFGR